MTMTSATFYLKIFITLCLVPMVVAQEPGDTKQQAGHVLDQLHAAAANSDFDTYFGLYAQDAVFMGTDPDERWSVEDLKGYARPRFEAGNGWRYSLIERNVFVANDGQTAWFDEVLYNENLGNCRGTGVLERRDGAWKIVQYSLSIPIPNPVARGVVGVIREHEQKAE